MRRKNIAVLAMLFILMMMCFRQSSVIADGAIVVDSETKDRLIEQYGLDEPEPINPAPWSQIDFGISNPISIFVSIGRLFLYPYAFAAHEFVHYLID